MYNRKLVCDMRFLELLIIKEILKITKGKNMCADTHKNLCLLHLITFACLSKGQGRWNSYFSFLLRTHINQPHIKALDDLSDAKHEPLRMPSFIRSTRTENAQNRYNTP